MCRPDSRAWSLPVTAVNVIDAASRLVVTLLAGYLIWTLRRPLQNLFTRPGSEVSAFGVTIKVGDQQVSVQDATDQLRVQLDDLQGKVIELLKWQAAVAASAAPGEAADKAPIAAVSPITPRPQRILWVDDRPSNNAYLVEKLKGQGIGVVQARSTDEGVRAFQESGPFTAIITDMGRQENQTYVPTAGLELGRRIRELDPEVPMLVYSSARAVRSLSERAEREAGITLTTSSPVELLSALHIDA
jgi:CheY-like chemotaxis protein